MKRKYIMLVIAAVVLISAAGGLAVHFLGDKAEQPVNQPTEQPTEKPLSAAELLDLGEKYLLELNYEQAVIYFTKVIEIEPMNVRAFVGRGNAYVLWDERIDLAKADYEKAIEIDNKCVDGYLGLVDVHIRLNDFDKAMEIAKQGYEKTGSPVLKAKIDELESGNVTDSSNQPRKRTGYYNGVLSWYHILTYEKGEETGVTSYDASGKETGHVDTLYDDKGNIIQGAGYVAHSGELIRSISTYDERGKRVRQDMYHNSTDGIPSVFHNYDIYEYKGDNIWKSSYYYPILDYESGKYTDQYELNEYWIYEYDDNNNCIKTNIFDGQDKMTGYSTFENGKCIESVRYDLDGNVSIHWEYVYDDKGMRMYSISTDAEGNTIRVEN